jgi:succinate dehydrogenase / fumarate reductase cytochrome b subunit
MEEQQELNPKTLYNDFKSWLPTQLMYVFSGCIEEKYPGIKRGLQYIGKLLKHQLYAYDEQSCCTGPLTKMGFGDQHTLSDYTKENLSLRKHKESIVITSCNGCYSYMIKSEQMITDLHSALYPIETISEIKPLLLHSIEYLTLFFRSLYPLIKYSLEKVKFSTQYGCHYLNQYDLSKKLSFRNVYAQYREMKWYYNSVPRYLEGIVKPLRSNIIPYPEYLLCCGGSTPQRQINEENAISVATKKFSSLHSLNEKPDAILTICPLCMYWMEDSQLLPELKKEYPEPIPIIHINELLAIALGDEETLSHVESTHKISLKPLLEKIVIK